MGVEKWNAQSFGSRFMVFGGSLSVSIYLVF